MSLEEARNVRVEANVSTGRDLDNSAVEIEMMSKTAEETTLKQHRGEGNDPDR